MTRYLDVGSLRIRLFAMPLQANRVAWDRSLDTEVVRMGTPSTVTTEFDGSLDAT